MYVAGLVMVRITVLQVLNQCDCIPAVTNAWIESYYHTWFLMTNIMFINLRKISEINNKSQ